MGFFTDAGRGNKHTPWSLQCTRESGLKCSYREHKFQSPISLCSAVFLNSSSLDDCNLSRAGIASALALRGLAAGYLKLPGALVIHW